MLALPMPDMTPVSASSFILFSLLHSTLIRIWSDLKGLVIEPAQHELEEWVLTVVRRHLLFENGVKTMKMVVPLTLKDISRHEVSQAEDMGFSRENMESAQMKELFRLVCHLAFDSAMF